MKRIILLLLCLVLLTPALAGNVLAATEWKFGASLRFSTFWTERDAGSGVINDLENGGRALNSDGLLTWAEQSNSRIRINMKSDTLEGYAELGYNFDGGTVTNRYFWGKYKFNEMFAISIGQQDQLFNSDKISRQVWDGDWAMVGIGTSKRSGTPKIILTAGDFAFALSQLEAKNKVPAGTGIVYDRDSYIPQLQASYQYKADTWRLKLAGAFQTFEAKNIGTATAKTMGNKTINSWLIDIDGDINFGPLYLGAAVAVGQNWADANWNIMKNYSLGAKSTENMCAWLDGNNKLKNTTSMMVGLVAGYSLTESLRFEAGAGYRYDENDVWKTNSSMWNIYLQAAYR